MRIDTRTAVIAVTVGTAALAGSVVFWVEGSVGSVAATAPTAANAANPVPILQRMHVPIPSGVVDGNVDIYGDRYAVGQFADGEQVAVYTYADEQAFAVGVARNSGPSDVDKLLVGKLFTITVTGVDTGGGSIGFPESVALLSRETGARIDTE